MPYDCEAFKKVLEETPFDHEWDEKIPTQKGYKAAGLKRYKLDHGDTWEKTLFSEKQEETFSSNQSMQTGGVSALSISGSSEVKIEIKEWALLLVEVKVIKSADIECNTLHRNLKKVHCQLSLSDKEVCPDLRGGVCGWGVVLNVKGEDIVQPAV